MEDGSYPKSVISVRQAAAAGRRAGSQPQAQRAAQSKKESSRLRRVHLVRREQECARIRSLDLRLGELVVVGAVGLDIVHGLGNIPKVACRFQVVRVARAAIGQAQAMPELVADRIDAANPGVIAERCGGNRGVVAAHLRTAVHGAGLPRATGDLRHEPEIDHVKGVALKGV